MIIIYKTVFTYQDTVWFMNEQTNKWVKRLNLQYLPWLNQVYRLNRQSDRLNIKMAIHTANRLSHERLNNTNIIISSKNYTISTVLWVLSHLAQWHNVLVFRTSRTSRNFREPQGMSREAQTSSEMTLWHAGTLLACWHTHAGTVDRPMA